jgi:phage RecT family recombinase
MGNIEKKKPDEKRDEFMAPIGDAKTMGEMVSMAEQQLQAASGGRIDPARIARLAVLTRMAAQRNPDLLKATKESLFWAFLDAARCGLEWDGEQGALVPFYNNKRSVHEAKFLPMYRGLIHLVAEAGVCHDVRAVCVYAGDHFMVHEGTSPSIVHMPSMERTEDKDEDIIACYAVAVLRDQTVKFRVITRAQLLKRKAVSRATSGPWTAWFPEMCQKTVIKSLLKLLPKVPLPAREAVDIDNRADSDAASLSEAEGKVLLPGRPVGGVDGLKKAFSQQTIEPPEREAEPATPEQLLAIGMLLEKRKMAISDACKAAEVPAVDDPKALSFDEAAQLAQWLRATDK